MRVYERQHKGGKRSFYLHYMQDGQLVRKRIPNITTRADAEKYRVEFERRLLHGQIGLAQDEGLSLRACLERHIDRKEGFCTEDHLKHLKAHARQLLRHFGGDRPAKSIEEAEARRFASGLRLKGERAGTINRKTGLLVAAIETAVAQGWLAKNPLRQLGRLSETRTDAAWTWLREGQIEALLEVLRHGKREKIERRGIRGPMHLNRGQDAALLRFVVFCLNTGARKGEALRCDWRDVDLERGVLTLYSTKSAKGGRSAKPRHIPINASLRAMLEGLPHREGRVLDVNPHNIRRQFERACRLAEIERCRVHDLRHTFASHLAINGVPLNTIRVLLGHGDISTTLRYAHLSREATESAVAGLNFGGAGGLAKVIPSGHCEADSSRGLHAG